jgi:hypothetical protein
MPFGTEVRMNNWKIMAPHAAVGVKGTQERAAAAHKELELLPGLKKKGASWLIPSNALDVAAKIIDLNGADISHAKWMQKPTPVVTWPTVEAKLARAGELRPFVLDGFLTPYQIDAISFGWTRAGVHYWHPTGSGKTLTGIVTALSSPGPLLIVTRAASRLQYGREVVKFTTLKPYIVRPESERTGVSSVNGKTWHQFFAENMPKLGKAKLVAEEWKAAKEEHGVKVQMQPSMQDYVNDCRAKKQRPVIVVGWEALRLNYKSLIGLKCGSVIFDESHRGKNSKRWDVIHLDDPEGADSSEKLECFRDWTLEAKGKGGFVKETEEGFKMFLPVVNTASSAALVSRSSAKRICTTATPIKDRVRDLWSQLDLAEPNAHGSKTKWEDRYCDRKPGVYGGFDNSGTSNVEELKLRLSGVAHILKYEETHRHLPQKRRQSVYIAPEDQCRPTGGFAKERREAKSRGATAVLEVSLAEAASRKRPAVLGLVEDHVASKQKVVLFTGRRRDCDALGKSIRSNKYVKKNEVTVWCAHGKHDQDTRDQIVRDYMAHPGPCVLVGTGPAFGESLNIHDTDAAFFVMLPYTPGQLRQWEGRFCRLGQQRPVVIYYVVAEGTVDEHMASILIDKLPAVEKVVDDTELGAAKDALAGMDTEETSEEFAQSILADLDW